MGKDWDKLDWTSGGGMATVGLGARAIPWPSFSSAGAAGSANATCATCGGRMRGTNVCSCETPDWRVKGKPLEPHAHRDRMTAIQAWHRAWLIEAFRVLWPGGQIKVFGGSRVFHRLAAAMEDSGFTDIEQEAWAYGSGFPKSHNVSKALDRLHGAKREMVGRRTDLKKGNGIGTLQQAWKDVGGRLYVEGLSQDRHLMDGGVPITTPATDDAKLWDGWGTALKPAWEPVLVGQKPCV